MRFNTKVHYGIRAMIEIAIGSSEKGIFQKDIAKNQDISNKYLDQIIAALKVKGLIRNVKGRKSGYILNNDPASISLYDIYCAFEPEICLIDCLSKSYECKRRNKCQLHNFCQSLNDQLVKFIKSCSLRDILSSELDSMNKNISSLGLTIPHKQYLKER